MLKVKFKEIVVDSSRPTTPTERGRTQEEEGRAFCILQGECASNGPLSQSIFKLEPHNIIISKLMKWSSGNVCNYFYLTIENWIKTR